MNKIRKEICKFKCQTTGEEIIFTVAYVEGKLDSNSRKLKYHTLAIIGGMHGSEFCSIEAIIKLLNDLESNKLLINGKLIITNIFNLTAFKKNINFTIDSENNENNSENMNHYFWNEILKDVDFCIELHSGDAPISIANCIYVPVVGEQITDTIIKKYG
ncbi:succinylglutamate desuccinylase/aspartoacylase domain-containing protein [Brachyspira alvinipulli]|uniref:succinylglutamate desuccinylase/aspartoacylase domain-containing protein n=1 Tax=Brachyspira alvinipulli TaxID=84379 RepID=UPI000482FF5F|nr:succinylglutamate desuccinylase/aspartoacylase family protein [Brachyspira alvinipulli]